MACEQGAQGAHPMNANMRIPGAQTDRAVYTICHVRAMVRIRPFSRQKKKN